ncbi:hypothetical protein L1987_44321 [Smallanthus sonchifolius]|uniref:Uncharacterized protein n=1 Tax=Smallanthus sonchifolius TaxID=185202 RepID=A0ACB9GP83_9ASTR|nr:hypothetical protein L1987_44321 [Smallanthus sonchifolius]
MIHSTKTPSQRTSKLIPIINPSSCTFQNLLPRRKAANKIVLMKLSKMMTAVALHPETMEKFYPSSEDIVVKSEGSFLEMPTAMHEAKPTLYNVVKKMINKMGYKGNKLLESLWFVA